MAKPTSQTKPQQRYRDTSSTAIALNSAKFNCVKFLRNDYSSPCKQLPERFMRDFTEVKP